MALDTFLCIHTLKTCWIFYFGRVHLSFASLQLRVIPLQLFGISVHLCSKGKRAFFNVFIFLSVNIDRVHNYLVNTRISEHHNKYDSLVIKIILIIYQPNMKLEEISQD